jgi:hypothetical protein
LTVGKKTAVLYSRSLRDTIMKLKGRDLCQELLLEYLTGPDGTITGSYRFQH